MVKRLFSLLRKYILEPSDEEIEKTQLMEYCRIENTKVKRRTIKRPSLYRKALRLMLENRRYK
jgi:hypothetical protein